jgi:transposase-like protein
MGMRRQRAIDAAVRRYSPPKRKLDFAAAEEIRHRFAKGEAVSSLADRYEVAPQTIRPILQHRIYRSAPSMPWRGEKAGLPPLAPLAEISLIELYWLTGWLEGEGSFSAPPPSDQRRPRISAQAKDRDVVERAARLCRVTPTHDRSERILSRGWSPTWRLLVRGSKAISLMLAIKPALGARRKGQIETALSVDSRT